MASHTKLVSYSQWNPQLTTIKQTSLFIYVKYVKYKTEYRTLTFCFEQHRQGGLIAPWKTCRWDRETISFWWLFDLHSNDTVASLVAFMNPHFITPVYPVFTHKTIYDHMHFSCRSSIRLHVLFHFTFTY